MKCHLCKQDLPKVNNYGQNNQYTLYRCLNDDCSIDLSHRCDINYDTSINQVWNYSFIFEDNNKWYEIEGTSNSKYYDKYEKSTILWKVPNIISHVVREDMIFEIPRFYPVDINKPIDEQLFIIWNKLKPLIIFS